jgi:glyoxylate reductase
VIEEDFLNETEVLCMQHKYKILVTCKMPQEWFPDYADCELVFPQKTGFLSQEELIPLIADADAAIILFTYLDDAVLRHCTRLKAVTSFGAGYDSINVDDCTRHGVFVCNTPEAVCEPTAEFTIGMILDTLRTITWRDRQLRTNPDYDWGLARYPSWIAMGKTLGIVGMGRIGKAVARRAIALGMNIVYYNRHRLDAQEEALYKASYLPLADLLAQADVVSLHTPLTPQTKGMIGAHELSLMKPTAHLVNMARGPVVDEAALIEALQNKRIAGAALDVFDNEPNINPIFKTLENVVITPHVGVDSAEARMIIAHHTALNLLPALQGRRPKYLVNTQLWND